MGTLCHRTSRRNKGKLRFLNGCGLRMLNGQGVLEIYLVSTTPLGRDRSIEKFYIDHCLACLGVSFREKPKHSSGSGEEV